MTGKPVFGKPVLGEPVSGGPVPAEPRRRPRTCVACREESPKRALIRVVRSPSGDAALDERGKLPGRGAYLCARLECVEKARKSKALSRALKTEVKPEVYDALREYISSYGTDGGEREKAEALKELRLLLGLARRAGLLYIGVDGVKSNSGGAPLLILTAAGCSGSVRDTASGLAGGGKHVHLDAPLDIFGLSSSVGAEGVQAVALPGRSGLADKIKMLISGQRGTFSGTSETEGSVALEQNASI